MTPAILRACATTFIASFCTLVIEISAGRILAPHVGVSLYTWTSIIGVVLAGISAGAWAGGWLADKRPQTSTLGWLLLASAVTALLIAPTASVIGPSDTFLVSTVAYTLMLRVVLLATMLFFLPSFFLGMISPVAVKLALADPATSGRVVGVIYAFSTLGSIVGTFATGFYFIARFGTRSTMVGVGVVLLLSAIAFGNLLGRLGRVAAALFAATLLLLFAFGTRTFPPPHQRQVPAATDGPKIHFEESAYYTIQVEQTVSDNDGKPLRALQLDHLIHSYADLDDPTRLEYAYLEVFNEAIRWKSRERELARLLFIGGGGYTLPRLTELMWPGAEIDVVEIDPAVTRAAQNFFGLPRQTAINTINDDARWFAMNSRAQYDLIFIDAFNDLSVPYHLTTREFVQSLRKRLAPDGLLAANLIDNYARGRFLGSFTKTLQSVFGENNVTIVLEGIADAADTQSTYVVMASPVLERAIRGMYEDRPLSAPAIAAGHVMPQSDVNRYVRRPGMIVLTDDYVPVDNMLAPLFAERYEAEGQ